MKIRSHARRRMTFFPAFANTRRSFSVRVVLASSICLSKISIPAKNRNTSNPALTRSSGEPFVDTRSPVPGIKTASEWPLSVFTWRQYSPATWLFFLLCVSRNVKTKFSTRYEDVSLIMVFVTDGAELWSTHRPESIGFGGVSSFVIGEWRGNVTEHPA